MSNLRTTPRVLRAITVLAVLAVVVPMTAAAARPQGVTPMPNERILTESQQATAVRNAHANERPRLEALFEGADHLPVAYTSAYFAAEARPDGTVRMRPLGAVRDEGSQLRIPDRSTAALAVSAIRYDLYVSLGIARLSGPGYRWVIATYYDWRGTKGLGAWNAIRDGLATSWAGDLTLYDDFCTGRYIWDNLPIACYLNEVINNEGVAWDFNEFRACGGRCTTYANWGTADAYITETSWKGRSDNVSMKYLHTYADYVFSWTFGLRDSAITITPNTSAQWSAALYATFTH